MKRSFIRLGLIFISLTTFNGIAQNSVTVAFDPVTTIALGGYEVELGFNTSKNRITASYLQGKLSPWFGQGSEFPVNTHSVAEFAYSRFLNEEQKGFSYGLAFGYYTDFTVADATAQTLTKNPSKLSVKLGYAWFPFKKINLYVEPIMTFGFLLNDSDLVFDSGEIFRAKTFIGNGPLFNIGYKFNF